MLNVIRHLVDRPLKFFCCLSQDIPKFRVICELFTSALFSEMLFRTPKTLCSDSDDREELWDSIFFKWRGLRNIGFNIQNFFYFQHKSHSLTQFNTVLWLHELGSTYGHKPNGNLASLSCKNAVSLCLALSGCVECHPQYTVSCQMRTMWLFLYYRFTPDS